MPHCMLALHNTTTKETTEGREPMLCVIRTSGTNPHLNKKHLKVLEVSLCVGVSSHACDGVSWCSY